MGNIFCPSFTCKTTCNYAIAILLNSYFIIKLFDILPIYCFKFGTETQWSHVKKERRKRG